MQANITSIRQRWDKAKLKKSVVFWIAAGAVLLTLFLGFTRGGWTTGGSATNMAEKASSGAVVERLTSICVAQFNADTQRTVKLEELKAASSSQRSKIVKEQGWATMPGETDPDNKVARECTNQIMLIAQ
jgi:hypothetical protein